MSLIIFNIFTEASVLLPYALSLLYRSARITSYAAGKIDSTPPVEIAQIFGGSPTVEAPLTLL